MTSTGRPRPWWLVADVVAVLAFAGVGRRSHAEGLTAGGVLSTAAPFLLGVLVAWVATRAWSRPLVVRPVGLTVWAASVVIGLLGRRVLGEGTAAPFVLVAALTLAVLLLGWRLATAALTRPRARSDHLVGWAVVRRADGAVLLARRDGVTYGSGRWGLPGGHIEDGESLAQGAARELAEEVGLQAAVDDLDPLGVTRYVDGPMRGTDFFFAVRRWTGEPQPVSECSQVGWFDPAALPEDSLPWLSAALRQHLLEGRWFADHPES